MGVSTETANWCDFLWIGFRASAAPIGLLCLGSASTRNPDGAHLLIVLTALTPLEFLSKNEARRDRQRALNDLVLMTLAVAPRFNGRGDRIWPATPTSRTPILLPQQLPYRVKRRFRQRRRRPARLQVNADVYYNDYGPYQTAGINTSPSTPATPTFNTISSPMKSYDAELEMQARPWTDGTVSLNASYTHARYGGFGQYQFLIANNEVPGDVHAASEAIGDFNASLLLGPHYSITAYVRNIADNRFIPDNWVVTSANPGLGVTSSGSALSDPRAFGVILSAKF